MFNVRIKDAREKRDKIAVIGCGEISEAHLNAYSLTDNVELVAVADVDEEKGKTQAQKFDTNYYLDYKEMLHKEKPDGVSICLPTFLHKGVALDAIKRRINILCEKPLAATCAEAQEMIRRARQNDVFLMTGFCWRFHPPIVKIKEYISQGKLGRILMFRLRFGGDKNKVGQWSSKKNSGGGVLVDESVHAIDLFRYLIGEIKNVSGRMAVFNPGMEVEDSVIILLESDKGTMGVIEDSWSTPGSESGMEIYGEKGSAITDFSKATFNINDKAESFEFKDSDNWLYSHRFRKEIEYFLSCLDTGGNPLIVEEDGVKAMQAVEAVRESVRSKKWVELQ